mmetsp:Transcript_20110/g.60629  ORF Transcript_20110/g.60629 Transcript_20110/m.60629 type:complete len:244 (+) Transcript_20110:542-1273(+)
MHRLPQQLLRASLWPANHQDVVWLEILVDHAGHPVCIGKGAEKLTEHGCNPGLRQCCWSRAPWTGRLIVEEPLYELRQRASKYRLHNELEALCAVEEFVQAHYVRMVQLPQQLHLVGHLIGPDGLVPALDPLAHAPLLRPLESHQSHLPEGPPAELRTQLVPVHQAARGASHEEGPPHLPSDGQVAVSHRTQELRIYSYKVLPSHRPQRKTQCALGCVLAETPSLQLPRHELGVLRQKPPRGH